MLTTSVAVIALCFANTDPATLDKPRRWLLNNAGRESHWFWKWKFRIVDRAVQFDPERYGWPWFPGTLSWVVPTAFSLIALKQSLSRLREKAARRINLGTAMLRDRACPQGGWNAGNGIVLGSALIPHIDTTAIALLTLTEPNDTSAVGGLNWLRQACINCPSAYSLAWSAIGLCVHEDYGINPCVDKLRNGLPSSLSIETLSLAAIAINAAKGRRHPFEATYR